jgi:hypothetical protein
MTVPAETSTCDRLQILRYCGGVGFTARQALGAHVCLTPQIRLGLPTHPVAAGRHESGGSYRKVWFQNIGCQTTEPDCARIRVHTDTHVNVRHVLPFWC